MSDRYSVIAALMQDPQNLLCIVREWKRIDVPYEISDLLPPPVIRAKGDRVTFPTLKEAMLKEIPDPCPDNLFIDHVAEVFVGEDMKWVVSIPPSQRVDDMELELGPFDSKEQATSEAIHYLEEYGFKFIAVPWTPADISKYPMK